MGKKINLFHREIEVKILLEVLGVYGVLALVLVGMYYLEPAITGFVTVTKHLNYTDEVNLEFDESGEYIWNLANPGSVKSIKISGSMIEQQEAKVYIEDDGTRYLIFDSSKLVEKDSGMFGITGFAVAENVSEGEEPNHPPVWNSTVDSFIVNGSLTINLDYYFNDKDGDAITYSALELKTSDLEILLENGILTVNNENNIVGNRTLEIIARDNETSKKKNIVLILVVKTVINETPINDTIEKIIDINLEYGNNEIYDANNDGVESLDGIIDFSVWDSDFNWEVNEGKLCTRYEIYSVENQESGFECFGNNDCCNFVGLESSKNLWNENLFLGYGGYGSSENNIVFAQILYVDYDLNVDEPYSDVAYSSWDNLTAKFLEGVIEFEDVCVDTCIFSGNASSYKLVIEMEEGNVWIDEIKYSIEDELINNDPLLVKEIENISVAENKNYTLDLREYFSDDDNDELIYDYYEMDNITVRFEDNLAYIIPDKGFTGVAFTFITASDSFGEAVSNLFKVEVKEEKLSIELLESITRERNWTVGFRTTGTGNLMISAINGATYSELYDDNVSTIDNLGILELRCGDFEIFDKDDLIETADLRFVLMNDSRVKLVDLVGESVQVKGMYIENYNCDDIGYYVTRVLTKGESVQEFDFSSEIQIAGIDYLEDILRKVFEIRDKEDNKLMVVDSLGNVDISGSLNENESVLVPPSNSFVIQDKNGNVIAYVNSTGSIFLKGTLTESVSFE